MAENYDVLVQYGDDLIPLSVPRTGTIGDLKRQYAELFDTPVSQQDWSGRIGELGVDDSFPLSGLGLENGEPFTVFRKSGQGSSPTTRFPIHEVNDDYSAGLYTETTGQLSPRTAAAIAASLEPSSVNIPITSGARRHSPPPRARSPLVVEEIGSEEMVGRRGEAPIVIEGSDDEITIIDDDVMDDFGMRPAQPIASRVGMGMGMDMDIESGMRGPSPVIPRALASDSPWLQATGLLDRMSSMMDGPGFGMRAPVGGSTGEVLGYMGPGQFVTMPIVGREKSALLQLLSSNAVTPYNWRIAFPSRSMGNASPLHYPNADINDAIQDAHEQGMFLAVHLFNKQSESSDFYNMIVSVDEIQGIYADNYVSYYVNLEKPIEINAISRLISPSQARPPSISLPIILLMATMKGRLHILDIADSSMTSTAYLDKLLTLRMTHAGQIEEDKILDQERRAQTSLVDEQNSAFELSVRQDQQRAALEAAEAERVRLQVEARQMEEAAAAQLAQDQAMVSANMRAYKRSEYIDELAKLPAEPTEGRNTTIALRMVDGTKVQRKFNPDTATLGHVFTFAAGSVAQKATDDNFSDPNDPAQPWAIESFDLAAQFPNRRFTHAQSSQTLRQVGLSGQELLNLVDANK